MQKYRMEFILHVLDASARTLKNALAEFGEGLEISDSLQSPGSLSGRDFEIKVTSEDPTVIFDICAQFGKIKKIKVSEEGGKEWQRH